MDINQCPNCQNQYDQDRRVAKQLPCGCVSCLQCYKIIFQFTQKIECTKHQQVYNINPEELQDYVVQEPILQELPQPQEQFVDQEQINEQFRCMQNQYEQKKNQNREILKEIQDSSQLFQHIQVLAFKEIIKSLLDQSSISNERIKNLLKRLAELKVINVAQQQQNQMLGQQDSSLSQNPYGQLQHQFQQILSEIEELKKDQQMNIQSLRINIQRCMFNLFAYLIENTQGQLLTVNQAESLVQKYFKQFKVVRSLSQVSGSVVQQKSSFQSQNIDQQLSQEIQRIDQQQYQNQVIDKQQGQELVLAKQFSVSQELSQQNQQIIDARLSFSQLEQKFLNLKNDFRFVNQIEQFCQEQAMSIVPGPQVDIAFDNLLQFLTQIKVENVSIQSLNNSLLNISRLTEYPQILNQLATISDQLISLKLIQILNITKNQPQIQKVAANALTILNFMNHPFANIDLSNLNLTNSDLSDTTFTSCNFSNSNLTQANLRNSKFLNCNFTNSNLTSIITEHPHIFSGHTNRVYAVAISSDSEFIVSGSDDGTIILWNIKTGTSKTMSGHTDRVYAVAISRDSEFIVSGGQDRTMRLWDVKTGNSKTMSGNTDCVLSVVISRDSEFIVSGSYDKTVRLWDVKTGTSKTMSGHKDYVTAVAISSDSEFIVSGSVDNTVRLWNSRTQQCIKVLKGHTSYVSSVIFSSNNKYIISGSYDKTIRVWSVQSGECLCTICGHTDSVGSLSLSRDGNWLVPSKKYYAGQQSNKNFRRWNIGRLLNVSGVGEQNQVKLRDWNKVYAEYGLGFKNCTVTNILMSVEDRERYIK